MIAKTPEEARAFIRKIMGPPSRILEGQEKEYMLTIFQLLDPVEETNNQRVITEVYKHAGKTYHVSYWWDEPEVEEILDDFQQDKTT